MTDNEIAKALNEADGLHHVSIYCADRKGNHIASVRAIDIVDLINRLKAKNEALIAGQETLQKALVDKIEESEYQSQNFKVLVSDHRCLQQSFENLKGLYKAEKAKVEKAKEKCIKLAKELQTSKAELKETTEKFNCQQTVYTDLSDIIKEKNAEIDRLNGLFAEWKTQAYKLSDSVNNIRAEVIKEFLTLIKAKETTAIHCNRFEGVVSTDDIEYLAENMVGNDGAWKKTDIKKEV